jgi:hypothetical protein
VKKRGKTGTTEKRGNFKKARELQKSAGTTCLCAPGHLEDRKHDGCVGRGLLLQELHEGLGNGLVDLGGLPLVAGVSAPPATWTEIRGKHWKGSVGGGFSIAIYGPMVFTAPYVMLLMRADTLRGPQMALA